MGSTTYEVPACMPRSAKSCKPCLKLAKRSPYNTSSRVIGNQGSRRSISQKSSCEAPAKPTTLPPTAMTASRMPICCSSQVSGVVQHWDASRSVPFLRSRMHRTWICKYLKQQRS